MSVTAIEQAVLHLPTRIVFGENAIDQLGDLAREIGGRRALLVTDPGIAAVGHEDRARETLESAGLDVTIFDDVHENPTTDDVDACCRVARDAEIDLIVGLGGGSSIDTARGCNFLLTNGGSMHDYWGVGKAPEPMLPLISVPTTTGTGSEMQSFALICDAQTHQKMACGDKKAASRVAILDPTLSMTQPHEVIAHTGMDCIAHAVESAVSTARTEFSRLFSRAAWELASTHFQAILDHPSDLHAQGQMLLASAYAGVAIEHSMLGAAHALANPLTATFDIVHGQAVGMMLPHVMRFNAEDHEVRKAYADLARRADRPVTSDDDERACAALIERIEGLMQRGGIPGSLRACGVGAGAIDALAETAARQWTARFNPRRVGEQELAALYSAACT